MSSTPEWAADVFLPAARTFVRRHMPHGPRGAERNAAIDEQAEILADRLAELAQESITDIRAEVGRLSLGEAA